MVEYFMKDMPAEWLAGAKRSPGWPVMVEMGSSLEPDAEALALAQSAPRSELWAAVAQPTLVLVGEHTQPIMQLVAQSMVSTLVDARTETIDAPEHGWSPGRMASRIAEFLAVG